MNRRDFLKSSVALAASASLPQVSMPRDDGQFSIAALNRAMAQLHDNVRMAHSNYVAFIHPTVIREAEHAAAREAWRLAYRTYRKQRSLGLELERTARYIFDFYGKTPWTMRGTAGRFEGVQFIRAGALR